MSISSVPCTEEVSGNLVVLEKARAPSISGLFASRYDVQLTYPDITWKLFVVPVCWKSCMMAAIMVANISKSVSQHCAH